MRFQFHELWFGSSSLAVSAVAAAAPMKAGEGVFTAAVVAGWADVAAAIARLIGVEVVELLSAAFGQRSVIAVARIEAVVDMAVEVGGAVVPVARSDKHSVHKPIGPVVGAQSYGA